MIDIIDFTVDNVTTSESDGAVQVCVRERSSLFTSISYTVETVNGTAQGNIKNYKTLCFKCFISICNRWQGLCWFLNKCDVYWRKF